MEALNLITTTFIGATSENDAEENPIQESVPALIKQQQADIDRQCNWLLNLAMLVNAISANFNKRLGASSASC